jgi:hypothetical protein
MYARLNYVDVKPDRFVDMDPYWREAVGGYDKDLVRGWFLRDGDSPRTLSLVVFESEGVARSNTSHHLGQIAARAADMRASEPQVCLAQVVVSLAVNTPRNAGVAWIERLSPSGTGVASAWEASALRASDTPGFCSALLLAPEGGEELVSVVLGAHDTDSSWAFPEHGLTRLSAPADWQVRVDVSGPDPA